MRMISYHYDTIDSTSDQAQRLTSRHPGQSLLVSAGTQTAGRGRSGRGWRSPLGGAWFSVVWPMNGPIDRYACSTVVIGWSVLRTIQRVVGAGCRLKIKWPNDVLLNGKKVAGVLCEQVLSTKSASQVPPTIIIGVGINANLDDDQLSCGFRYPATSIQAETGRDIELQSLVGPCVEEIQETMLSLEQEGFGSEVFGSIEEQLAWVGQWVSLRVGEREVVGMCMGLDPQGRLRIQTDGQEQAFDAGEVGRLSLTDGKHVAPTTRMN